MAFPFKLWEKCFFRKIGEEFIGSIYVASAACLWHIVLVL